jgi:MSHA biogenesis protein MshK
VGKIILPIVLSVALPTVLLLASMGASAGQGVINGVMVNDPTGPWGAAETSVSAQKQPRRNRVPSLQAIFVRDNRRIAIMDDKEVSAGNWVSGYQIHRVTDDYVYFVRNGKEFRLSLFGSKIKH